MEIVIIILGCLLFAMLIVVAVLYNQQQLLEQKFKDVVNEKLLNLTLRTGFYEYTTHLLKGDNTKKYDIYVCMIYVTELEKYDNGYSKIKLDNISIVSGVDISKYNWVKKCVTEKFNQIIESKDVTWLEKNKDISEVRKDKLERILKDK